MLAKVGDLLQQPSYRSKAGRVPTLTTIGEAKGVHYVVMAEVGERIKPHQLTRALAAQVRVPGARGGCGLPYVSPQHGTRQHHFLFFSRFQDLFPVSEGAVHGNVCLRVQSAHCSIGLACLHGWGAHCRPCTSWRLCTTTACATGISAPTTSSSSTALSW
jgi:hypothetical protein